jgi:hypothetical protein
MIVIISAMRLLESDAPGIIVLHIVLDGIFQSLLGFKLFFKIILLGPCLVAFMDRIVDWNANN